MLQEQPDQFLSRIPARTDNGNFGFVDVSQSNKPRIIKPGAWRCKCELPLTIR
jgi:hypothetical protein